MIIRCIKLLLSQMLPWNVEQPFFKWKVTQPHPAITLTTQVVKNDGFIKSIIKMKQHTKWELKLRIRDSHSAKFAQIFVKLVFTGIPNVPNSHIGTNTKLSQNSQLCNWCKCHFSVKKLAELSLAKLAHEVSMPNYNKRFFKGGFFNQFEHKSLLKKFHCKNCNN
jgi:hypothetical protein